MTELPRTRRMQVDEAQCKVKKIQDRVDSLTHLGSIR